VRALWAEIADQLAAGHDLTGTQLTDFKAAYASGPSGLLTRYAEPWEADLAKAYAQKLEDGEHHGLLDRVESALGDAGDWAYNNIAVPTVNGAASLGGAIVNDPGDTATTALGLVIMAGGDAIEGGGVALDATGVGAVAGVPLNALGAGVIATGAGVTTKGAAGLANYANQNRVHQPRALLVPGPAGVRTNAPKIRAPGSPAHGLRPRRVCKCDRRDGAPTVTSSGRVGCS
jgi:hypothetical protein